MTLVKMPLRIGREAMMRIEMVGKLLTGVAALSLITGPATAADAPASIPATVSHQLQIGDRQMRYDASWSEHVLHGPDGAPEATVSGIAYVRKDVPAGVHRPVTIIFNGGPGASSSPLHLGLLGPNRMATQGSGARQLMPGAGDAGSIKYVPNDETLLDVSDLLFVDPVATGFSREIAYQGNTPYLNPWGDVESVEAFVRDWLRRNGRESTPIFILGESYGGFRGGLLAGRLADLDLRGLILISPGITLNDRGDVDAVTLLPSLAEAAVAQGRVAGNGRKPAEIFKEASDFAIGDYAAALAMGNMLDEVTREQVASRMSALVGLPKNVLIAAGLKIPAEEFIGKLVPDKLVSMLDSRVSSDVPKDSFSKDNAVNDPLLAMGMAKIKTSPDVSAYLTRQTGQTFTEPYVTLSLDANFAFDWRSRAAGFDFNRKLSARDGIALMAKKRPKSRILVTGGYYDLATPLFSTLYEVRHFNMSADRIEVAALEGGHTSYSGDEQREQMSELLHDFVAKGMTQ
ncbi:MAG: hypothetical protein QM605_14385 [Sphingobium sp.]